MATLYILLILTPTVVMGLIGAAYFFAPSSPNQTSTPCERRPENDAGRGVALFQEIGKLLARHARALVGSDSHGERDSSLQRAANLATLRHCNREARQTLRERNAELEELTKPYGGLYRDAQYKIAAYAAKTEDVDRAIGSSNADPDGKDDQLLRLVQEMGAENRRLQAKVADCQSQVAELMDQAARSDRATAVDALTQLLNRSAWDERLQKLTSDETTFVAVVDVDGLKSVNVYHGLAAGDSILTMIGTLLRGFPMISAYRTGGDEFGLVVPRLSRSNVQQIADEVRAKIQRSSVRYDGHRLSVSVSIGVAQTDESQTIEAAVAHADSAMWAAKEAGGDMVVFSECSEGSPQDDVV